MERDLSSYEDVFASGGDPEPEAGEQAAPVEQSTEVVPDPAPVQPAQTADTATPVDAREANAFQALRQAERDRADALVAQATSEAIARRDNEWRQSLNQQPQQQQQEIPDVYSDPEGFAKYVEGRADAKVAAAEQRFEQQNYQRQMDGLMKEAGTPPERVNEAINFVKTNHPWMINGLNQAPNPFKAVVAYAEQIGFATAPAATTQTTISASVREQVLAEAAAERAANGTPPRPTAPRGVGSTPAGHGNPNGDVSASDLARLARTDPGAYKTARDSVYGQ